MRTAVIVFPGSNCDRDLAVACRRAGADVTMVWHKETALPADTDLVAVPGGFSFGDYLRSGAIAALSPIVAAVKDHALRGGYVLGICNGFQILTEARLLPGALQHNKNTQFISNISRLRVETSDTNYTCRYNKGDEIDVPIAHREGNYSAKQTDLDALEGEDRIVFRYLDNPNGSQNDIAGIVSENRRVLGMMPHPERAIDDEIGSSDGRALFLGLVGQVVSS